MRWVSLVATAALSCGVALGLEGQGVRVRASGPEQVSASPGEIISAAFTVTNDNNAEVRFLEALTLPVGWQPLQPVSDFPVPPRASETRLVSFAVPRTAEAGTYAITYTIRSQRDAAVQDRATLTVVVARVNKVEALADCKSLTVVAGGTWETRVRVLNRGNGAVALRAVVEGEPGTAVTVEPSDFTLTAGGQQVVVLKGVSPVNEPLSRSRAIRVKFGDGSDAARPCLASASLTVAVIARQIGEVDLCRRLPTELGLRLSGGASGSAWQAQWSGAGVLDDQGKRKVSFLLRGPDTRNEGVFGQSSEAHLNYSDPNMALSLGDQTYGLSHLTEYLGYGRGAELDVRLGEHDQSTVYWYQSQGRVARFSQVGLRVQHQLDRRWLIATNLLSRRSEAQPATSLAEGGQIGSVEVSGRPARDSQVRLEFGRSRSERGGTDTAYELEARGKLGAGATYSLRKLRAGADYAGHVHDLDLSSVSLSAPVLERLRLSASLSEYHSNLARRPDVGGAPVESLWRVGADYLLSGGWSAGLTYNDYRQRDALGLATSDSTDRALGLVLAHSDVRSSVRATLSRGQHRDLSSGAVSSPWSLDLLGVYRQGARCTVTAFGGVGQNRGYDANPLLGLSRHAGASLDWQARPDLSCSLWYTDQRPAALFNSSSAQAQLLLSYHPLSGQSWGVQVRQSSFADGPLETSYAVTYTLPIALSIGRRHDIGVLSGRIFDAENPRHRGLAGAMILVGDQAVCSDAEGRFVVGGLPPGKHHVQVDRASIGLQRVTTVPAPVEVVIVGGQTARLDLGVVTAACVEGVVRLRAAAPTAGEAAVVGAPRSPNDVGSAIVASLLLELTCEGERRQCLSEAGGRFAFEGLRPGRWRLSVVPSSLPPHHFVESPTTELCLQAGQRYAAQIEIIERARSIRMLAPADPQTLISAP